jgi:hypothetical protein
MEIVNTTPFVVGCTLGTDKSGLDHLLAITKATFNLSCDGATELADEQRPLVAADVPSGEPGYSATIVESDYALFKPRCDVLFTGSAYAPNNTPSKNVVVSMSIGNMRKSLRVTGYREWKAGSLDTIEAGEPSLFTRMPFSYDTAFGGIDNFHRDQKYHRSYANNPVGLGYHRLLNHELLADTPMPNTEETNTPVKTPNGTYRPMALGPLGRGWPSRLRFAGTYDAKWQEKHFPFLPQDFDNRYFQAAPPDQQIDYLKGGETVELKNLTASGYCTFRLPRMGIDSVVFYLQTGEYLIASFHVDTLHFFPDEGIFTLTARASVPFSDDPQACSKVIFGRGSKAWIQALENGKRFISREHKVMGCKTAGKQAETEELE